MVFYTPFKKNISKHLPDIYKRSRTVTESCVRLFWSRLVRPGVLVRRCFLALLGNVAHGSPMFAAAVVVHHGDSHADSRDLLGADATGVPTERLPLLVARVLRRLKAKRPRPPHHQLLHVAYPKSPLLRPCRGSKGHDGVVQGASVSTILESRQAPLFPSPPYRWTAPKQQKHKSGEGEDGKNDRRRRFPGRQ